MSDPKPSAALLEEVSKPHSLKHTQAPSANPALNQALVLNAVSSGNAASGLKHVEAPSSNPALNQALVLNAVGSGAAASQLKHVDAPAAGPSDAVKQAFIQDRQGAPEN